MPIVTYLITGANRGIGKELTKLLLLRCNTYVVAAVRNPLHPSCEALSSFSVASGNKLIVVKIDSFSETDSKNAIDLLISQHGLTKLDVVIANAGICKYSGLGLVTPIRELQDHFNVNTLGPLILLQATWSLLQASSQPKFVVLTSAVGSMGGMEDANLRLIAYGTSKAAVNYIVRKLHFEYETLITVLIHPGWTQTEMGNTAAVASGRAEAPVPLKQSIDGITSIIDGATKHKTSGLFLSFDGTALPW